MEAATIRAGISVGIKIAEYFGLIETVATDVKKLVHQAFESANDNLEYARTANGQNQVHYVLEAKNNFIKAVVVEENENKVMALCGLSMCQYFLCDDNNAQRTMDRIKDVELTRAEKVKAIAMDAIIFNMNRLQIRQVEFEIVKKASISWAQRLLNE
jgi:hypothetical protein